MGFYIVSFPFSGLWIFPMTKEEHMDPKPGLQAHQKAHTTLTGLSQLVILKPQTSVEEPLKG